jgi:tRNA(Met) cytidine acetyltransferase
MSSANFSQWLTYLSGKALNRFNRQIVVLQGSNSWANSLLQQVNSYPFIEKKVGNDEQIVRWYIYSDSSEVKGNVNKQTFRNQLGTESHFVVFYHNELNLDALAALSGTLVSGGVLLIVLPEHIESSGFFQKSYFNQRLVQKLFDHTTIEVVKERDDFVIHRNDEALVGVKHSKLAMGCLTQEQVTAVKHVIKVFKGHRNRPLVLTADRGRGKSSALAIACAELLQSTQVEINIAITATHRKSLNVFFTQLAACLEQKCASDNNLKSNKLTHKGGVVQFVAIDELINHKSSFNLVIVDEAASISLKYLNELLVKYSRLVFSSTVHGYEGSGRSFALKFKKNIKLKHPEYKTLNIQQPIRWSENDPLELFIYDLCLLNTELPSVSQNKQLPQSFIHGALEQNLVVFEQISIETLMLNEELLQQIFSVLVTAHYQTSPSDLQLLLDNKNVTLVILSYQQQIVGVALLLKEGFTNGDACIESETNNTKENRIQHKNNLVELVQTNQRRLKDQFIPQSLLTHCGEESSFNYSYFRVMRIAILPELQGKGVGTLFLSRIEEYAQQHNFDFVGSSFGMNQELLSFWQQQNYKIARVGFTKDKASGEYSALLLKAVNKKHTEHLKQIEHNFYQSFDYLLAEQYQEVDPELVWQILTYCPLSSLPLLHKTDLKAVEDFYTKKRQYSVCVYHLHKWLQHQMKKPFNKMMIPIISKVFQRKDVSILTHLYGFTGKKEFNNYLIKFAQEYSRTEN